MVYVVYGFRLSYCELVLLTSYMDSKRHMYAECNIHTYIGVNNTFGIFSVVFVFFLYVYNCW